MRTSAYTEHEMLHALRHYLANATDAADALAAGDHGDDVIETLRDAHDRCREARRLAAKSVHDDCVLCAVEFELLLLGYFEVEADRLWIARGRISAGLKQAEACA
jgi:hypothetical protein